MSQKQLSDVWRLLRARSKHLNRRRARHFVEHLPKPVPASFPAAQSVSRLQEFYDGRERGRGVWKWRHYFNIYERHLGKFRGQAPTILEIGVYSGGSLDMWRDYFGPDCHIIGVDIEPAVKVYESAGVTILVGDQSDPLFWARVLPKLPRLDIVVDDGGHAPHQQIETLEALLPILKPGGVYICEDVLGGSNAFGEYVNGLTSTLDSTEWINPGADDIPSKANGLQAVVNSVHRYPFVTVVEKNEHPVERFHAPKSGTDWQPFLEGDHVTARKEAEYGLIHRIVKFVRGQ